MTYGILGEYDVSSIRREVERSLDDVSKVADKLETYKNGLDRKLSEIDSAFSSLERAMDDRVRELQRNAGKTLGYSSYSSADSNIKSERRKIDQLLDRLKDDARELENLRRQARSARGDVLPKFEKLERSHGALAKELERVTEAAEASDKKVASTSRELEKLSQKSRQDERKNSEEVKALRRKMEQDERENREEVAELQRQSQNNERKLRSELESERLKSKLAGAAAMAAMVNEDVDVGSEEAEERIAKVRQECDRKIAELTEEYEKKIAAIGNGDIQEKFEARIKRISDLLEEKKLELKGKGSELELMKGELSQRAVDLEGEREKNMLLAAELLRERGRIENCEKMLAMRIESYLMLKMFRRIKQIITNGSYWIVFGFLFVCLVLLLWMTFSEA